VKLAPIGIHGLWRGIGHLKVIDRIEAGDVAHAALMNGNRARLLRRSL
jgi:hypothetical protein